MEGLSSVARKRHFMSMADAKGLAESVGPQSRVLIIGAGLIGLKCAEGLKSRVKSIDIVDLAPRVLSSVLDEEGARLMQDRLEEEGIRLHLSTSVSRFSGSSARLAGGAELEFDELVLAVGVMPNIQLAKDAGIKTERGIVANSRMETSEPDVYAAGDNTLSFDVSSGRRKVLALLPNAYSQGECAGINMAGGCAVFDKAIPMNAIGLFGLHALTAGTFEGEVWKSSEKGIYKKLFIGDDVLNGFMIVGDPSRAGIYTSLVRERTPLGSLDFKLLRDRPSLAAFASPWRKAKLGGAL
jgi:NAD(P)H-nitrite reductase large subunit